MLKIVSPICREIDDHKSFVAACIATTNDCDVTTYKTTFTNDLRRCAIWLAENHCKDVCTESAGISRAGAYIKPLLIRCALCAIPAKLFPEVRRRYLALKKTQGAQEGDHCHC